MTQSKTFGRLLKMAVNGIATYEGTTAAMIEQEIGQQIGLSAAAIQRYKNGHLPPEARTIQLLATAAVQRGHLDAVWLREFLQAAQYRAEDALIEQLCPSAETLPTTPPVSMLMPAAPQPADPAAERNRSRMLTKVRTFWIDGVLEQSLHGAVLLELGMVEAPHAVERAWDAVVQQPDQPARTLPFDTPISEVYDDLDQALLILGAPGSGKTTLLLELARDLLDRAEQDEAHPIPVVFNLSTWHANHGTLATWLVDELHTRYHVPRAVAQAWVAHDQILPLLDGLDETAPTQRESCVAAINSYCREHGLPGLAVCSRIGDYDLLQARLQLQGAVVLQPLSDEQIERYLDGTGQHLAAVRVALRQDRGLRELAETPLLLSIMSLAYQGKSLAELETPESVPQRRHHLFETYIERMFTRRTPATRYAPEQVRIWLHWLAQQMHTRAQSVFFLEDLQPDWLSNQRQRWQFAAGVGASVGLLAGFAVLFITGLAMLLATRADLHDQYLVLPGLLLLLIVGGLVGRAMLRTPRWLEQRAPLLLGGFILFSLGCVLLPLIWISRRQHIDLLFWLMPLLPIVSGLMGAAIWLAGAVVRRVTQSQTEPGDLHLPAIRPVERLHWSWQQSKSVLATGVLLGQGAGLLLFLVFAFGSDTFTMPALTALIGLTAMLTGGAVGGFVLGLIGGLTGGEIDLRTIPNQGIHQSAWHSLRMLLLAPVLTLVAGGIAAIGTLLVLFLDNPASALSMLQIQPNNSFGPSLLFVMLLCLPLIGVLLALASGGATCLQHSVLRLMLTRNGAMPWRYVPMLDYAAERLLLRKVGGGYIFVHRLLLEHIATTPPARATVAYRQTSAGQPTIRLPNTTEEGGRGLRPADSTALAPTIFARLGTSLVRLLTSGLASRRAITRLSITVTLAMLLAGSLLAGILYIPSPQQQQWLTTSSTLGALALSTDGTLLATDVPNVREVKIDIRDSTSGALLRTFDVQNEHGFVRELGFAPGDDLLAIRLVHRVEVWDVADGTLAYTLVGNIWMNYSHVAFTPDGRTLALVSGNKRGEPGQGYVLSLYDGTDGTLHTVITRDTRDGWPDDIAFTPDSRKLRVALNGAVIETWDLETGTLRQTYNLRAAYQTRSRSGGIVSIVLSPDGTHAVTRMYDDTLGVWRLGANEATRLHTLEGHRAFVTALAFSPDGRLLATGSRNRIVRVWDVADGTLRATLRGHWDGIQHIALTDDGWLVTGGADFTLRLWDVAAQPQEQARR